MSATWAEFDPDARVELDAAATRYEQDYPGRGARFYAAVERAVLSAVMIPGAAPLYPGLPEALAVRRRVVPGFPFALVYRDLGDHVRIIAVAHQRRRPGYWMSRSTAR